MLLSKRNLKLKFKLDCVKALVDFNGYMNKAQIFVQNGDLLLSRTVWAARETLTKPNYNLPRYSSAANLEIVDGSIFHSRWHLYLLVLLLYWIKRFFERQVLPIFDLSFTCASCKRLIQV